jgi:hypothetical protein
MFDAPGSMTSGGGDAGIPLGECEEPADCPGLFLDCRTPSCINTNCGTRHAPVGQSCDDGDSEAATVCDGLGSCVECADEAHCDWGEICHDNHCVPAHCADGELNGGETDLDCGGPCGRSCELNQSCDVGTDCESGVCASGLCAPCTISADCVDAEWCDAGICVAKRSSGDTCTGAEQCLTGHCPEDGVCCSQECTGLCMACIPGQTGLGLGECGPVLQGDDFEGECPDQGASSCGSNGTGCDGSGACILYPSGTVCAAASCSNGTRARPDECDGSGTCDDGGLDDCSPYHCNGTDCRTSCSDDGHCLTGSYCDASNQCVSAGGLGDPCGGDNECNSGYCRDGRCCESSCTGECMACANAKTGQQNGLCRSIPTSADPDDECTNGACFRLDTTTGECRGYVGEPCGSVGDCLTAPCVDGYCCESTCSGLCRACDGAETAGGNGQCRYITASSDPDGECPDEGPASCGSDGSGCDGAGQCILYPASTVCQSASCINATRQPPDYCNGSGSCIDSGSASCAPYRCDGTDCRTSCSGDLHCVSGYFCQGTTCTLKGDVGDPCGGDNWCANDRCVDGYCCDSDCTGVCESCSGADTIGSDGVCSYITPAEDPDDECPGGNCNGSGACT